MTMQWGTPLSREEEQRRLLGQLGMLSPVTPSLTPLSGGVAGSSDPVLASIQQRLQTNAASAPQERGFFDRLFAPLEAPQQTLFALTTGRGLWDSLSHGARYFNPFSNEERIDAEEVRETLFGPMADGWVKTTSNLALSLLFDPLLFAPMAKVAGAGANVVKAVDKVTNPASLLLDVANKAASEVVGPLARTAYGRVFGEEGLRKLDRIGVEIAQAFGSRFAGVDPGLADKIKDFDSFTASLRGEGVRAVRTVNNLTPEVRPLLTEALETSDVWANRMMHGPVTFQQAQNYANFEQRVLSAGADPDLFWQAYDRVRSLDDKIGQYLLDSGIISTQRFSEMQGTHLRRIFQAYESPQLMAERIDYMASLNIPDRLTASYRDLRKSMTEFSDNLFASEGPIGLQNALFPNASSANQARYFDTTGKFHAKNFTDDIISYISGNSNSTLDELFTHVQDNMLGGIQLPGNFFADLGNWLTHGSVKVVEGSAARAEALRRGLKNTPTFTFRDFAEQLKKVQDRKDYPQWYAEALGEILDAAPRIASEVQEAGGVVAARRLFDDISGTRRLSADDMLQIDRATEAGFTSPEARAIFDELGKKFDLTADELADTIASIRAGGKDVEQGTRIGSKGTAWASEVKDDALGHIYQIPNDASYGEMAGMYTDAATSAMLRSVGARDTLRTSESKALGKLGDLYRDGVGVFKFMKTVADPVAHIRNFLGGAILADMQGIGFNVLKNLPKMRDELFTFIQTGHMGKYIQLAEDAGVNIWGQDFASVELANLARKYLDDLAPVGKGNELRPFTAMLQAFNNMTARIPFVAEMARRNTGTKGGLVDFASGAFSMGDQFWKLGVFIDKYDGLASAAARAGKELTLEMSHDFARQAAGLAQQALFNYADVPWGIEFIRKWGVVPFATFPFKAAPFVAKTLYENPWRVLKYDRVVDSLNDFWTGSPEDTAREIDGLPEYMRDAMVIRLPWNDDLGRPQYADLSYYLPWAIVKDIAETLVPSRGGGFREGIMSPPFMSLIDALRRNEDSLGRKIVDTSKGRSQLQNFEAVANYLISFTMPSWVPGGSRAQSMGRSLMAVAATSPTPNKWSEMFGLVSRSPIGAASEVLGLGDSVTRENVLAANGRLPQQSSAFSTSDPWAQFFGGMATGAGAAPVASDPLIALSQSPAVRKAQDRSTVLRQIAAVRSDPALSVQDKAARVARLMAQLR